MSAAQPHGSAADPGTAAPRNSTEPDSPTEPDNAADVDLVSAGLTGAVEVMDRLWRFGGWEITQILNTHEHGDHIGGVAVVARRHRLPGSATDRPTTFTRKADTTVVVHNEQTVVIGGMGSYVGAFVGAMILGMARAFGDYFALKLQLSPTIAEASTVIIMIIVLLLRPQGLFGKKD